MDIKEFIANKKAEINKEWESNQKDEWTNGYYNALSDIDQALSQHDVIKNEVAVCDVCGSDDITEAPHMGRNCNSCNPL